MIKLIKSFIVIVILCTNSPFTATTANWFSAIRSFPQTASSEEDNEEWRPPEPKPKAPSKTARDTATGGLKAPAKRTAKTKEPKAAKQPKAPKLPKDPKPSAPRKPAAGRKTQVAKVLKDSGASGLAGTKRKKNDEGKKDDIAREDKEKKQTDCPEEETAEESGPSVRMKEEVRHTHTYTKQDEMELATISNIFHCFFKMICLLSFRFSFSFL